MQVVACSNVLFLFGNVQHTEATLKRIHSNLNDREVLVAVCKDGKLDELQVCISCVLCAETAGFTQQEWLHSHTLLLGVRLAIFGVYL